MSEGDQDYRSHEYIADREREAYNRARGDFEHRGGGHMPVGNGDMSVHRAKEVAANAAEHYGTQQNKTPRERHDHPFLRHMAKLRQHPQRQHSDIRVNHRGDAPPLSTTR
ncbi:hypothetical protein CDG81_04635 [Actinopolyspora erythraea]|uniref:Uncharacterized protein n=1 Tax=Actinopolyspora erythraea TaxID=414996 RepID=A0A223RPB2_9ACTN|nr:hypothetical protein [Actinopolyspora erythraea]ASU77718.1 hypothetical protein CDG81_04635 [Actinopolyspora erythraea]